LKVALIVKEEVKGCDSNFEVKCYIKLLVIVIKDFERYPST